MSKKLTV